MRLKGLQLVLLVFLAAMSACQKNESEGGGEGQKPNGLSAGLYFGEGGEPLAKLPLDTVVLRVNGVSLTRKDFELDQDVYCKLTSFCKSGKFDCNPKDAEKFKAMRAPVVLNTLLRRELLNQEAKRRGIKASERAVSERAGEFEKLFADNDVLKGRPVDLEELARKMGGDCGRYFLQTLEKDAENLELSWQAGGDRLKVSEDEVTVGSNRLAKANALVKTTNDVLIARLHMALNRVKAGEEFSAVGSELSMFEKEESKEWGTFAVEDFEDTGYPDMEQFLRSKPVCGSVAGPFQCDDGISVVKVIDIVRDEDESGEDESGDDVGAVRYKLARISVETFEFHPSLSRDEIRKILEDDKRKKFESELGRQLFGAAVIEFPAGTNLFQTVGAKRSH